MKFPISYNKKSMTLQIKIGKYTKYLQCPFATWWKARKYFKRPKFKFYFGPTCKIHGKKESKFGEYLDYTQKGIWPMASTEYLKWMTPKWFPIYVMSWDIAWKDKMDDPRFENDGYFIIFFGRNYHTCWQFSFSVSAPEVYCNNDCTSKDFEDNYWESILWYLYYAHKYNKPVDINTRKGTRTYEDVTCNIVKARDTMRTNHWSRNETTDMNDCSTVLNFGFEKLNMGLGYDKEFFFVDIKSDKLFNILNISKYNLHNNMICSDIDVAISIKDNHKNEEDIKIGKSVFETSKYLRIVIDKNSDNNYELIRLYFNNYNGKLADRFIHNNYTDIELSYIRNIDLGPSFKDEFLNKNGIKEIRKYYKENKV